MKHRPLHAISVCVSWVPGLAARGRSPGMTAVLTLASWESSPLRSSQRSAAGLLRAPDAPCPFSVPEKMRGAERRQALVRKRRTRGPPRGRAHLRIAGDDGRERPAVAPLGALLRRSHYGVGPRFPAFAPISQLLAGDRCVPGRSPDAARVRGCEPRPRAPPQSEARNCRAPAAGRRDRISGPAYPACSATKTPHDGAPRRAGCASYDGSPILGQGLFT